MTIYITPFNASTMTCTGKSEPAGFDTLDDMRTLMGTPIVDHPAVLVYGLAWSV
jgi:hypothetical protein